MAKTLKQIYDQVVRKCNLTNTFADTTDKTAEIIEDINDTQKEVLKLTKGYLREAETTVTWWTVAEQFEYTIPSSLDKINYIATIQKTVWTVTADAVLDDLTAWTTYTGQYNLTYKVEIDATWTPDTFKWSSDGGVSYTTGVDITGSAQTLNNGVTITFWATTWHTLWDKWEFDVTAEKWYPQQISQSQWNDLMYWTNNNSYSDVTEYWLIDNNKIKIYPAPSTSWNTILVNYMAEVAVMSSSSTEVSIKSWFENLLMYRPLALQYAGREEWGNQERWESEYSKLLFKYKEEVLNPTTSQLYKYSRRPANNPNVNKLIT